MSMNIAIMATREIIVAATGEKDIQYMNIDVWQTPTDLTYELVYHKNPIQAYMDWVLSVSKDEEEPVYAPDDYFCERDPIGVKIVNYGRDHVEELQSKIEYLSKAGWEFEAGIV